MPQYAYLDQGNTGIIRHIAEVENGRLVNVQPLDDVIEVPDHVRVQHFSTQPGKANNAVSVDVDGDNHSDFALVDNDGDGAYDMAYFDTNGDGYIDANAIVTDGHIGDIGPSTRFAVFEHDDDLEAPLAHSNGDDDDPLLIEGYEKLPKPTDDDDNKSHNWGSGSMDSEYDMDL